MNDNIRYTVTVLFNEIFKTIFAENQAYICAVTDDTFLADDADKKQLIYSLKGEGYELQKNAIYIIEDSQLDLGLTVAVERNLQRIFSIMHDYLDWHMETLEASLNPPQDPQPPIIFTEEETEEGPKKKKSKGIFSAIGRGIKKVWDKITGLFKRKPKKQKDSEEEEKPTGDETEKEEETLNGDEKPTDDDTAGDDKAMTDDEAADGDKAAKDDEAAKDDKSATDDEMSDGAEGENGDEAENGNEAETEQKEKAKQESADKTEAALYDETTYHTEDESVSKAGFSVERKPYHERYYMLYGQEDEISCIDLTGTLEYLSKMGIERNSLKQAREGKKIAEMVEATFKPGKPDARYCDFCGTEIFGVEYETLSDGRDRCLNCGRTAIKTGEEFRKIFEDVKRNMESFFGIRINAGIKVEMVNSKTLHKRLGKAFIPTPKSDGRVLGVAISDKNGYTLMVENGSPRMASMLTMAHELTHIWQYINWNDKAIRKKYGKKMRLEIYEGMAKWVEIQYAYLINEPAVAKREEIMTSYRDDEYGRGFLRYRANYAFSLGTVITKPTPFMDVDTPLDPQYCGTFTVKLPTDGINPGDRTGGKKPGSGETPTGGGDNSHGGAIKGPIDRNPKDVKRYAYSLLNDEEKSVYDAALEAIKGFVKEISGFKVSVTDTQMQKIMDYIQKDHPEIFWFQHGATYFFDQSTHIISRVELTYCMTQDEAKKRQDKIDMALKSFLTSIHDNMSDYEVTLHIYENIIKLVDYDTIGLERQKKTTVTADVPDDLRSIYGVFVNKKAVCAGYAKATQYLLNLCGIECTYVISDTHAWNLIKLEGDYYHLDTTWGDGSNTKKEKNQSSAINYDCFCITSEELSKLESHTPESKLPMPECTATKCNYHRRHGLYFEKFDYDKVRTMVCESVKQNKMEISFKFSSAEIYNEAKRQLVDGGKFREAIQYANLKSGNRVSTSYMYSSREELCTMVFFVKKLS